MYVDETMITGHLDHARFSGERCGRILNHLFRSHSVFRTARSTRSLVKDADRLVPDYSGAVDDSRFCDRCRAWGHTNNYCGSLPANKRRRVE